MIGNLRMRWLWVGATALLLTYFAAANWFSEATRLASPLLPDRGIRLGLDLQGGIHWVVGVKLDTAVAHELEFQRGALVEQLKEEGVELGETSVVDGRLRINLPAGGDPSKVLAWTKQRGVLTPVSSADGVLEYTLSDRWRKEVRDRGMAQVLEVLRRRIEDPIQGIPALPGFSWAPAGC